MKICVWSSSFQADTLALAMSLDQDPSIDLLVVTSNKAAIVREPIFRVRPLTCDILDRDSDDYESAVKTFNADIVFADNHIPPFTIKNKFLYHWHGLGPKIRSARDLRTFHRHVSRLIGNVKKPNPRFLAQCYGDPDYDQRLKVWRLAEQNCRIWGSAFSDLLISPPYSKRDLAEFYNLDLVGRKTILLSISWQFSENAFGVLGDDDEIFSKIVTKANELDANLIFSLHDKFRYSSGLIDKIERHARQCKQAFIKYKSEHLDNLADLVASDVMICTFSSFITYHYFTGKPSIHILPVDSKKAFVNMPTIKKQRIRSLWRRNSNNLWMYPFSAQGGLLPESGEALIDDLQTALLNPHHGRENAERFIRKHFYSPDGNTRQRIISDLKQWSQQ